MNVFRFFLNKINEYDKKYDIQILIGIMLTNEPP